MRALSRMLQTAVCELESALHSRRALVLALLYLISAICCMYGTISLFGKIETEVAKVLQLPEGGKSGVISATLWKSESFSRMVQKGVGDDLVFADIQGLHPVELAYAWIAFMLAPFLAAWSASNRIAEESHSGSVRYVLVRCTRAQWALGKYLGQVFMVGLALLLGALGAWLVAAFRLGGVDVVTLLPGMMDWALRAWLYSVSWLGLALGISQMTRSSNYATFFAPIGVIALDILPSLLQADWCREWGLANLDILSPLYSNHGLWRRSLPAVATSAFHLTVLGLFYWTVGHAVFRRRDA